MSTQAGPQIRKPSTDDLDLLAQWRTEALEIMPYMAAMLFSLQTVDAPGLGTFACDDKHRLYVDFESMRTDERHTHQWCVESMLHECGHLFGRHRQRAEDAGVHGNLKRHWNVACDLEINDDLTDAGCQTFASDGMLPSRFGMDDHLLAEQYFEPLERKAKQRQQRGGKQPKPGGKQPGGAHQGEFSGCGSASGGQGAPCELGDDDGSSAGGEPFAPGATDAEKIRVEIATAAAIRDHAAKGRGTVPAGLRARAEQVLAPPKIPWRQVLASAVKRAVAKKIGDFDADPTRRSRRRHDARLPDGRRVFYPGTYTPKPSIAVVRDTSGSMSADDLNAVTNEVDGISRSVGVRGRELRVLDVDAEVHETIDYTSAKSLETVAGRGGTDMRVGITAAEALKPHPAVVVVVSDGGTPWPTEPTRIPLVICLVGPSAEALKKSCPDWATVVVVDD